MEIEPLGDGRFRVTVRLHAPEADDVWLIGGLAGAEPTDRRLRRSDDGWWSRSYEIPGGTLLSYRFATALIPEHRGEVFPDPLNSDAHVYPADPELPDDEESSVSLVRLPDSPSRRWSIERDVPRGKVEMERIASEGLGNTRRVFTYRPPGYEPGGDYPLVVCFDGWASVTPGYVPLPTVLDNLIAEQAIPPLVAVLPDSIDAETRARELTLHEPFVAFLADELLPWARQRVSFTDDPTRTVATGVSLGGLAAAFCALSRPDVFGLVLAESGAFQRGDLPACFAAAGRLPLRFHLDVGAFETVAYDQLASLYHANLHLRDVLAAKGYEVTLREYPGGHDFFWWRETIADGLAALLG